jgi:hypothetical protein
MAAWAPFCGGIITGVHQVSGPLEGCGVVVRGVRPGVGDLNG